MYYTSNKYNRCQSWGPSKTDMGQKLQYLTRLLSSRSTPMYIMVNNKATTLADNDSDDEKNAMAEMCATMDDLRL